MKSFFKKITPIIFILSSLVFPKPSLSEKVAIHSIITFTGKVTIKTTNWNAPRPASVGFFLKSEDILIIPVNASILISCSNLNTVEFKQQGTYKVSDKCPVGKAVLQLNNINNTNLRTDGQTEEDIAKTPYLITPRNTFILTKTPQLRWNKISGATSYIVKIDRVDWTQETNQTEITYTGNLEPNKRYRVTITTNNGIQEDETVGFELLDENTRAKILKEVEMINQLTLSSEEKGMILAQLYQSYELYSDAIAVLEDLVKQGSKTVAIYQLLGDIYLETGLPQLAKKPYEKGLQLAIDTKNLPAQAEIQKGLGITYYNLGKKTEAKQWLEKAKASYTELGDSLQVQELDKIIIEF